MCIRDSFNNVRITNLKEFSISFLARDHIIKMLTRYNILNDTDKMCIRDSAPDGAWRL